MHRLHVWARPVAGLAMACAAVAIRVVPVAGAQNPSLLFSTPLTAGGPVRVAVDPQGYIYLAGTRPTPYPPAGFVMKLTPSRSVVYTTYLQGTRFGGGEPGDCLRRGHARRSKYLNCRSPRCW